MQRLKDIIFSVIITTFVICATQNIMATVRSVEIPVNYNDIKIIIDGKILKTDKEPFIYEGTTYLPVRSVAEAVGKEVSWDGKNNTVTLKTIDNTIENPDGILLYDEKGVKVVYNGIENGIFGKKINLYIENNSDSKKIIEVDKFSVNGIGITPVFSCEVDRGKRLNSDITILTTSLDINNINEVRDVEFVFEIFNNGNHTDKTISDKIKFKVN